MDDELRILDRIDLPAALDALDDRIMGALAIRRREALATRRLMALATVSPAYGFKNSQQRSERICRWKGVGSSVEL